MIVVDDGSPRPVELASVEVLRQPTTTGPGAARNAGAGLVTAPLIAFVDAGLALPAGCLERLAGSFADEHVVAAAPRIRSAPAPGLLGVVEHQLSSLAWGTRQATCVRARACPTCRVRCSWFAPPRSRPRAGSPSNCTSVKTSTSSGASRAPRRRPLRRGVVALHPPRRSLRAALRRRFDYGTSDDELHARHPGQVRHLVLSPWFVLPG